ncbi:MAG: hypothetical protein L0H31_10335 [Nocardioidaceae bacterium]|nr:hypothetical protein [Nocardioidaceae bacterium]
MSGNSITPDNVAERISSLPATISGVGAWWATDHPDRVSEYDQWVEAIDDWHDRADAFIASTGFGKDRARANGHAFLGFAPRTNEKLPKGWIEDSKIGIVRPSRRTKADRESVLNQQFDAVRSIPQLFERLSGIPETLWAPGKMYRTVVVKRDDVLVAILGASPESNIDRQKFEADETWVRLPVSTFHLIQESDK